MEEKKLQTDDIVRRLNLLIDTIEGGNVTRFADKLKMKQSTIYNYIKGRTPNAETLFRIKKIFGVNLNWLITGEGEMFSDNRGGLSNSIDGNTIKGRGNTVLQNNGVNNEYM